MHTLSIAGVAALTLLAVAAIPGFAASAGNDPLAAYRWKTRLLVVLAPDATDPRLVHQRDIFRTMKPEADERDLVLVEAIGDSLQAAALRRRFDLDGGFHALLVGKDGDDKLVSAEPLGPAALFPLIDAMPMRRDEMGKR